MTAHDGRQLSDETLRAEVGADLRAWSTRYPLFDPARFPALAATTVAYLPTARRADRALAALVSLWIVAFDALVDERDTDTATLDALATRYGGLTAADRGARHAGPLRLEGVAEQLDAALREIVVLLDDYHPPTAVRLWWEHSCRATIAAIVRQRELGRTGAPPPRYTAALPLLVDSIGVRPYLAVGAIVGREPGLVSRLAATTALAGECALAIRLANDLRTWEKDESEGGFNTLTALRAEVVSAEPTVSATVAHDRTLAALRARLASSMARCHGHPAATAAGATASAMVRVTEVVVAIYAAHDYHTYRE